MGAGDDHGEQSHRVHLKSKLTHRWKASDPGLNVHEQHEPSSLRFSKLFLAGVNAGAISRTITAPLDRIKLLMQVHYKRRGLTMTEVAHRIRKEGSLVGFWQGNGANILKVCPETALKLSLNDRIKRMVCMDEHRIKPHERFMSGALAGCLAQFCVYPLETIHTRIVVSPAGTYSGVGHVVGTIWRSEGVRAFYRGLLPSCVGIIPYAGVDIAVFEILKNEVLSSQGGRSPTAFTFLGTGMLSASVAQLVSYPFVVVRTRMQVDGSNGKQPRYPGRSQLLIIASVFRTTVLSEGFAGLYKGLWPSMIKLAPAQGVSWLVFEKTKQLLGVEVNT